jgi:hypothetical protein
MQIEHELTGIYIGWRNVVSQLCWDHQSLEDFNFPCLLDMQTFFTTCQYLEDINFATILRVFLISHIF